MSPRLIRRNSQESVALLGFGFLPSIVDTLQHIDSVAFSSSMAVVKSFDVIVVAVPRPPEQYQWDNCHLLKLFYLHLSSQTPQTQPVYNILISNI